jgi:hypothetical protein
MHTDWHFTNAASVGALFHVRPWHRHRFARGALKLGRQQCRSSSAPPHGRPAVGQPGDHPRKTSRDPLKIFLNNPTTHFPAQQLIKVINLNPFFFIFFDRNKIADV